MSNDPMCEQPHALCIACELAPTEPRGPLRQATRQLDGSSGLPKTVRLQRTDGRWYLLDR
jgi:hypothetical protein